MYVRGPPLRVSPPPMLFCTVLNMLPYRLVLFFTWFVKTVDGARLKGEDLYEAIPVEADAPVVVEVMVTPSKTVYLTLEQFQDLAILNREFYNNILQTLRFNISSGLEYNPLLRGLPDADATTGGFWGTLLPPTWADYMTGKLTRNYPNSVTVGYLSIFGQK